MLISSKVKLGVTPEDNARATLIVCLVMAAVTLAGVILHRQQKAAKR